MKETIGSEKNPISDFSVAIPTKNRAEVLKRLLNSLLKQTVLPKEVLVVDDSTNEQTKSLVESLTSKFSEKGVQIGYVRGKGQSVTEARNRGIAFTTGRIHCSLDDDVVLYPDYVQEILKVFAEHPNAVGVAGHVVNVSKASPHQNAIARLFPSFFVESNRARVLPTGISYPYPLTRIINGEWLNGSNCSYRREVLKQFRWDEKLMRYSLCDDMDFSLRVQKAYPKSLLITPSARVIHEHSQVARISSEYLTHMSISYHAYFFFKNMKLSAWNTFNFVYGLFFGRLATSILSRDGKWVIFTIKAEYNFLKNARDIKQGTFSSFEARLNSSCSLKTARQTKSQTNLNFARARSI